MSQKEIDGKWIETIRDIVKNERIELLYQPIVSIEESGTERYQVLLRTRDAEGNEVDIDEMLAAATRTGLSHGIDRLVILKSLKALLEQLKQNPDSCFFVPLSSEAIEDPALVRWLQERIRKSRIPASAVVVLVDAAAAATRVKQTSSFTSSLRKLGCGIALDQFGRGKDPFQMTAHVRADFLRIHEEFTQDLGSSDENQHAIRRITSAAGNAGIRSICPGIDDASMLSVLWGLGVDMLQGDFLQEPSASRNYDFSSMSM